MGPSFPTIQSRISSKSVQWSGFYAKNRSNGPREHCGQSLSKVERFEGYAWSLRNAREWFDSF